MPKGGCGGSGGAGRSGAKRGGAGRGGAGRGNSGSSGSAGASRSRESKIKALDKNAEIKLVEMASKELPPNQVEKKARKAANKEKQQTARAERKKVSSDTMGNSNRAAKKGVNKAKKNPLLRNELEEVEELGSLDADRNADSVDFLLSNNL